MKSFVPLTLALAAFLQGSLAATTTSVVSLPGHKVCATPTATTTTGPKFHCDIACLSPTSSCKSGEATGPARPTSTYTTDCTLVYSTGFVCGCASCTTGPTPTPK